MPIKPIIVLPSKLEMLHNNKQTTLVSIKHYEEEIKLLDYRIDHNQTSVTSMVSRKVVHDFKKQRKDAKEILQFHKETLKEIEAAIETETKHSAAQTNNELGSTAIDGFSSGVKQYDSVDAYMMDNELQYLKHKNDAKQAIPQLPEKEIDMFDLMARNETIFSKIDNAFKNDKPSVLVEGSFLGDKTVSNHILTQLEETIKMGMKMDTAEMKHYHLEHALEILKKIQN